jgi:short-subunit dehydrogenase
MTNNPKIILLTGSTSGMGKATATQLVKNASFLILLVRNIDKGSDLKKELQILNPNCQVDLLECDLKSRKYTNFS